MGDRKSVTQQPEPGSKAPDDMSGQSGPGVAELGAEPPGDTVLGDAALDPGLQAYIGQQLRSVYEEVLNEDVPDRFVELLRALERKQAGES